MSHITDPSILALDGSRFMLLPWQGTKLIHTLSLLLTSAGVRVPSVVQPYYLEVEASNLLVLREHITNLVNKPPSTELVVESMPLREWQRNKYGRYLPENLLRSTYAIDAWI
ncbi:MAG: hypothetical protein H0X29_06650 [Parachlamydiaceae bacterium]|nr:hypothetical protein [Parachlamydiaceae bacterium]